MPLHTIYFDTSALRSGNWPRPSEGLDTLLAVSSDSGIRLGIPEIVKHEARALYGRELVERVRKAKAAIRDVELRVGRDYVRVELPDAAVASQEWDNVHDDCCTRFSIADVPLPAGSLCDFVKQAAAHASPFAAADSGFRDSPIALSIAGDPVGARDSLLVASDKAFYKEPIAGFLKDVGCKPVRTVKEALDHVSKETLSAAAREFFEHSRALVEAANQQIGQLTTFLRTSLQIPIRKLARTGRVMQIDDVVALQVTSVYLPFDTEPPDAAQQVATLDVNIAVRTLYQPMVLRAEPLAKVGQPVEEHFGLGAGELEEREFRHGVTVRAMLSGDPVQFEFLDARFGSVSDQLLDMLVANKLRGAFGNSATL